jgi:hypothetical protein
MEKKNVATFSVVDKAKSQDGHFLQQKQEGK